MNMNLNKFIAKYNITDTDQLAGSLHSLIGFHKEVFPQTLKEPNDLNHGQYAGFFSDHWEIINAQAFYKIPFKTATCRVSMVYKS